MPLTSSAIPSPGFQVVLRESYKQTTADLSPLVRNNLRLYYARWLAQYGLYDEALEQLEKDDVVKDALGPHLTERFLEAKRKEVEDYNRHVSSWEIERYLGSY